MFRSGVSRLGCFGEGKGAGASVGRPHSRYHNLELGLGLGRSAGRYDLAMVQGQFDRISTPHSNSTSLEEKKAKS